MFTKKKKIAQGTVTAYKTVVDWGAVCAALGLAFFAIIIIASL